MSVMKICQALLVDLASTTLTRFVMIFVSTESPLLSAVNQMDPPTGDENLLNVKRTFLLNACILFPLKEHSSAYLYRKISGVAPPRVT